MTLGRQCPSIFVFFTRVVSHLVFEAHHLTGHYPVDGPVICLRSSGAISACRPARRIMVRHKTVRRCAETFGRDGANQIRRRAPQLNDRWHPDDGVIPQRPAALAMALLPSLGLSPAARLRRRSESRGYAPVACTVLPWFSFGTLPLSQRVATSLRGPGVADLSSSDVILCPISAISICPRLLGQGAKIRACGLDRGQTDWHRAWDSPRDQQEASAPK